MSRSDPPLRMPPLHRLRRARVSSVAALAVACGICLISGAAQNAHAQTAHIAQFAQSQKDQQSGQPRPPGGLQGPLPVRPSAAPIAVSDLWRLSGHPSALGPPGPGEGWEGEAGGEGGDPDEDDLDAIAEQYRLDAAMGRVTLEPEVELGEGAAEAGPTAADDDEKAKEKEKENSPKWIEHRIIPYEKLGEIAARYGVSDAAIIRWNKLSPKRPYLRAGKTLRIHAVRPPPPRQEIEYAIERGDSWTKIAEKHGVEVSLLKKWNPAKKGKDGKPKPVMIAGKTLRIWVEPELGGAAAGGSGEGAGGNASDPEAAEIRRLAAKVRRNAFSIGSPTKGRLVNGVTFPEAPELYTLRKPGQAYGSSHTIKTAVLAIGDFRKRAGYRRPLVIGAVSLPRGGRFRPHSSHQSGRDIDIRLPVRSSVDHHNPPRASEVDWRATWRLIKAFVDTGEVQYIFLDHRLQKIVYEAARSAGASKKDLATILQWPRPKKTNNGLVRHASGHTSHIHVRLKCGPQESKCAAGR